MKFEHPATVIDETVANLEYLADFFVDDIDHGRISAEQLTARAIRAIHALEALRAMLPRLRIVRSNYVTDSRLPDAQSGAELLTHASVRGEQDAVEAPAAARHVGLAR